MYCISSIYVLGGGMRSTDCIYINVSVINTVAINRRRYVADLKLTPDAVISVHYSWSIVQRERCSVSSICNVVITITHC